MPIVQVHSFLKKQEEKEEIFFCGKGLMKENKLYFKEKEKQNELWFQEDYIILKRKIENEEEFQFIFKEKEHTVIQYKSKMGKLEIPLYTQKLVIEKEKIKINYIVADSEKIEFRIELEWL